MVGYSEQGAVEGLRTRAQDSALAVDRPSDSARVRGACGKPSSRLLISVPLNTPLRNPGKPGCRAENLASTQAGLSTFHAFSGIALKLVGSKAARFSRVALVEVFALEKCAFPLITVLSLT
eukprot:scaffold40628_cov98-Phaeocystis_antarctica.AAC.1